MSVRGTTIRRQAGLKGVDAGFHAGKVGLRGHMLLAPVDRTLDRVGFAPWHG